MLKNGLALRSRRLRVILICGLALTAAIVGAVIISNTSVVAGPNATPPVTRRQVLDATASERSVVLRADRTEAKLTTWAALQQ